MLLRTNSGVSTYGTVSAPNMHFVPFGLAARHLWLTDADAFIASNTHFINVGYTGTPCASGVSIENMASARATVCVNGLTRKEGREG